MNCARVREHETPERYLRGELTGSERDEYELHYFSCESCYAELDALRAVGVELAQQSSAPKVVVVASRKKWIWWSLPVAACLILMLALPLIRKLDRQPETATKAVGQKVTGDPASGNQPDPQLLALAEFEPPPYREAALRSAAPAGEEFTQAMRLYQLGDYRAAAARLESLLSTESRSPRTVFYAAACRMLSGDPAAAERGATQAIELGETPYLEESYWLRAKARFALGNAAAGADDLRTLVSLKGDWEAKAGVLLRRLSELR